MPEIKSRPKWGKLDPAKQASAHLVCAERGAIDAVARAFAGRPEVIGKTILVHVAEGDAGAPASLAGVAYHPLPSRATALTAFRAHLGRAKMGTQLHLAGSEAFLNEASALAHGCGVVGDGLTTELCGDPARRVQCVHCKGMMDDVSASPVACRHCGVNLMVRDHYSRRLGAFMGVCVDAEAPGDLPAAASF
ncbi:hypothetical protein E3C22_09045 [Jiella endophytica]|uniref:Uncharacterized protein n=1 Tax=Jiella endophytica TaxID=2558362 RepID=A0A4Y8RQY4_9HYPH|nr:dimethylamine monooxygenase subunit DmmA family protein [Jiella endophytica]TFF25485.1 hypothetical protein E3C22_09045 [Jiella endophytica]